MANDTNRNRFLDFDDRDHVVEWHARDSVARGLKWTADLALGLVGFGTALASAAFAFVMINANIKTPTFGGSEYLLLFTRPLQHAEDRQIATRSNGREIDMTPTGTISKQKYGADNNPYMGLPGMPVQEPDVSIKSYSLQTIRGGVAIIKGPRGEFPVESGSILPNGDRVISIDRRNGRWVVVTSNGIISDQKTN